MNLLKDAWIPVISPSCGHGKKLTLNQLLCEDAPWVLSLPRDDMEFAALQLLICLVQILFAPDDKPSLEKRIKTPMSEKEYEKGIQQMDDWFMVEHPDYPFMQVKGVSANIITPMDKLLSGLDTATNSRFVNQPGMADRICSGCAAIALFNQANNAPNFGGGFQYGLRGRCPISTLIQNLIPGYNCLRNTIWFNILTKETMGDEFSLLNPKTDYPTWLELISNNNSIGFNEIGLLRGLFWQPNHVELCKSNIGGRCSLCGQIEGSVYDGFKKAKFKYAVEGTWPHPHSPKILAKVNNEIQMTYHMYKNDVPAWTQLSRFIVQQDLSDNQKEGTQPATVIRQSIYYWRHLNSHMAFIAGGYRNRLASVLNRKHDTLILNAGWQNNMQTIKDLVDLGLGYRAALYAALRTFSGGIKGKNRKTKGINIDVHKTGETLFNRQTDHLMIESVATIDFDSPKPTFDNLAQEMCGICRRIFENITEPYIHDPEILRTQAISKRVLEKRIKALNG